MIRELTLVTNDMDMAEKVLKLEAGVRRNYRNISYAPTKINLGVLDGNSWKRTILFRLAEAISTSDLDCETSSSPIKVGFVGLEDKVRSKHDFDLSRIPNKGQYKLFYIYFDNVTDYVVSEWVEVRSRRDSFEPITVLIRGVNGLSSCSTRIR